MLSLFALPGTPHDNGIVEHMNAEKVPHLFLDIGPAMWGSRRDGDP